MESKQLKKFREDVLEALDSLESVIDARSIIETQESERIDNIFKYANPSQDWKVLYVAALIRSVRYQRENLLLLDVIEFLLKKKQN